MPSILVHYRNEKIQTQRLPGIFRGLDWDRRGQSVILVGDAGRIVKVQGEKILALKSGTRQNLRAVSVNQSNGTALIVGNQGTIMLFDEGDNPTMVSHSRGENLRAAAWNPKGNTALIAGNRGTLLKYSELRVEAVDGGRANLRRTAWRPNHSQALVASNCFADEFIPSPNLFVFDARRSILNSLNEGRADLIGVDWNNNGKNALVVGYDVIWHNGYIGAFDGTNVSPIEFENKRVYPVAVSYNPVGNVAAIATATAQPGMGEGALYLLDRRVLKSIFTNNEFFFSSVAWNGEGTEIVALASSATRTFNC